MSVLIKGMDMPLHTERDGEKDTIYQCCFVVHKDNTTELVARREPANIFANCNEINIDKYPLIEIPTPHGDLIDRDILNECCESLLNEPTSVALVCLTADIGQATAVIEAEDRS